ncbi:hypothetical protein Ahy_B09g096354 isoform H [Arachis hypogaea]|uniref:Aminotransferase-like plant mobile domain-containing protein n=1 Tax=Arachis hypogaea TaxID=3818 RepID=A0A444XKA8_ARAHY|nr:hypothetical protein Ahy_B09g096354 isoform H [Arachis hypogaea]
MRRQQGMVLDDRYVPYLQMAGLYHLARLNNRWFRLDEALVSAFVERWRPETHTFHMPFGECTWVWFEELLGVVPPPSQVQKYAVNCSWFQETFGECPEGADEDTVRRYARAYIMMLLGTQLFADKSGNRVHIRWLPFVARLEEMGTYIWGSAALAWLYRCMCRVANRNVIKLAGPLQLLQSWIFWRFPRFRPAGFETFSWPLASRYFTNLCLFQFTTHNRVFIHNVLDTLSTHISSGNTCACCRWSGYIPSSSEKGPRVQTWRLWIDRLQDREVRISTDPTTSSSSTSPNTPSPTPTGGTPCKAFGRISTDPTTSPTPSFRSTAKDGEATGSTAGSYTGTDEEATAGLELEPAAAASVVAFRFEPPELDTTSTNFANNSGVLTLGNCLRHRNITCRSSSLPIVKQSYFTVSCKTVIGMR